jgi:hypothetical protein
VQVVPQPVHQVLVQFTTGRVYWRTSSFLDVVLSDVS